MPIVLQISDLLITKFINLAYESGLSKAIHNAINEDPATRKNYLVVITESAEKENNVSC
jgi:hypothetical protein